MSDTKNGRATAAPKAVPRPSLIAVLDGVTAEDLAALDQEIAGLERRLDALRGARKLVDLRINGPKQRKQPGTKAGGGQGPAQRAGIQAYHWRKRIGQHLLRGGQQRPALMATELDIPVDAMAGLLDHDWFAKTPDGACLSDKGKQYFG